jgi:[calcium/calmodulin-dependent protein kinase] kinase
VELGVDVGTGVEYVSVSVWMMSKTDTTATKAIKEFSKSRLHRQSIQQRQQTMHRARRGRPSSGNAPSSPAGKRQAGGDGDNAGPPSRSSTAGQDPRDGEKERHRGGPWSTNEAEKEDGDAESDPLGLIRREIAVMKKLE